MSKDKEKSRDREKGFDKDKDREEIYQIRKVLREKEKRIVSKCNHRKNGGTGKLAIRPMSNGLFECKRCGEEFSMEIVKRKEVDIALKVIHDMINQTRCLTDNEKHRDSRISENLGILNFDVKEAAELYDRIVRKKGEGENRDRDRDRDGKNDGFGLYSQLSLSNRAGDGKKDKKDRKRGYSFY